HALFQPHDLREHFRAANHRHAALARSHDLRIGVLDGRGRDHEVRLPHVGRVVAVRDARAEPGEPIGVFGALEIATRDLERCGEKQDLGQAAHPDASGPDEMEAAQAQESQAVSSASKSRLARRPAASGTAKVRARSLIWTRRARWEIASRTAAARDSPVKFCSSMTTAAPAFANTRALAS